MEKHNDAKLTPQEIDSFAESIVDLLLSPGGAWFREIFLSGVQNPNLLKLFLEQAGLRADSFTFSFAKRFYPALQKRDREALIALLKSGFQHDPPDRDFPEAFSRLADKRTWRGGILKLADEFKGRAGFQSKITPDDYASLAQLGEELAPVILKLLNELESRTRHSVEELIIFWSKDYPKPCEFLLKHIERLNSAIEDQELLSRAKRLSTRARLIADATAGAEYNLSLRTSIERAREGRRQTQPRS